MAKTLITGGGGFIGSHLAEAVLALGHEVIIYDSWSSGRKENIAHFRDDVEVVEADIRDLHTLKACAKGVTNFFHEAALVSVPWSIDDPVLNNDINVVGTLNALIASRDAGAERFVFASSAAVYGDTPELPKKEGMMLRPESPYALAKMVGEEHARLFYELYGLKTVALRYFNVFGPRQDPAGAYASVIPIFVTAMISGKPIKINGDGLQSRDFVYIKNVVQANLKCLTAPDSVLGRAFNVGTGKQVTLLDMVAELSRATGINAQVSFGPPRQGDIEHSYPSIEAAQTELGYKPTVGFAEGIDVTVKSFMSDMDLNQHLSLS
ncbi:MAG TPA: SDR family oxidoreductase [Fimbriimonadaceae bacterium]|jgi:nucleoside-diphosphate-sugar epimerase